MLDCEAAPGLKVCPSGCEHTMEVVGEMTDRGCTGEELGRWSGGHLKGMWESVGEATEDSRSIRVLLNGKGLSWGVVDIIGRTNHALRRGERRRQVRHEDSKHSFGNSSGRTRAVILHFLHSFPICKPAYKSEIYNHFTRGALST